MDWIGSKSRAGGRSSRCAVARAKEGWSRSVSAILHQSRCAAESYAVELVPRPGGGLPQGLCPPPPRESCYLAPSMKRGFLTMSVLIAMGSLLLSCGGGELSLAVKPASASIFTDYTNGTYQGVELTAALSNGAVPTGLQWKTSQACVAVGITRRDHHCNL